MIVLDQNGVWLSGAMMVVEWKLLGQEVCWCSCWQCECFSFISYKWKCCNTSWTFFFPLCLWNNSCQDCFPALLLCFSLPNTTGELFWLRSATAEWQIWPDRLVDDIWVWGCIIMTFWKLKWWTVFSRLGSPFYLAAHWPNMVLRKCFYFICFGLFRTISVWFGRFFLSVASAFHGHGEHC